MGRNKERDREYNKQYNILHRDEILEKKKKYHVLNKEKEKEYRDIHKKEIQEYGKEYRKINKEKIFERRQKRGDNRRCHLKKMYNMSLEEYESMLIAQNYKCKICGKHISELKRSLFVDHDHNTEKIRGLLCQYCNSAIAYFNDDVDILLNAISYLKGEIKQ